MGVCCVQFGLSVRRRVNSAWEQQSQTRKEHACWLIRNCITEALWHLERPGTNHYIHESPVQMQGVCEPCAFAKHRLANTQCVRAEQWQPTRSQIILSVSLLINCTRLSRSTKANQKPPESGRKDSEKLLAGSTRDEAWRTRPVGHEPHPADTGKQKRNHQGRTYIFVKKYIKFHWEYMNLICMMPLRDAQRFWASESNSTAHQRRQPPWNSTPVKRVAQRDAAWSRPKRRLLFHYHTKQAPPSARAFRDDLSNTDVTEKAQEQKGPHSLPNIPT